MLFAVLLRDPREDPSEHWIVSSEDQTEQPNTENIAYFYFLHEEVKEKKKKKSKDIANGYPQS